MDHSNFMEMISLIEFMYEQFIQDFLFDFRLVQAYITGGVKNPFLTPPGVLCIRGPGLFLGPGAKLHMFFL